MGNYGPKDLLGIVLTPTEAVSDNLERKLGLFSVVIISLSAMIGSGLFVLPALAMLEMGGGTNPVGGVWLAYLVAAFLVIPGAVSKSELSTAMPSSGGSYVYVEKTFGPLVGTIAGLGLWANFMLKSAFALIGFKAYLWVIEDIIGVDINIETAAIFLLLIIVIINILGVKRIKKIQTPIVMFSAFYLLSVCAYAVLTQDLDWGRVSSKDSFGSWEDVAATSAFVFVSYAGVTKIAAVGGEIKNPGRNMPYGILLSLLFSCLLYVSVTMVMAAAVEPSEYMHGEHGASEDPIYIFAETVGGETVGIIAAILAVITMTSMALAGILASSRFPFAMARDNLLPGFLENVHGKYGTPHWAIIGTGIAMGLAITFLPVHDVAELASGFKIMIFMLINACVIVLRNSSDSHAWYDPDRTFQGQLGISLVAAERHVHHYECPVYRIHHALCMIDHMVEGYWDCRVVPRHHVRGGISHQDDVYSRTVNQPSQRVVISGEHSNLLPSSLHFLKDVRRHFLRSTGYQQLTWDTPSTVGDFNHTPGDSTLWFDFFSHRKEFLDVDQSIFIRIPFMEYVTN